VQMQEQIEQQTRSMMSGFKFPGFTPPQSGDKGPPPTK